MNNPPAASQPKHKPLEKDKTTLSEQPPLNSFKSPSKTAQPVGWLFAGGASAGLIAFALFGGIWQVHHFVWVMGTTAVFCGLLAVLFRQNFQGLLKALLDNIPWF
ncbi:MAG: hypothetical protein ACTS3T_00065 [Almyronema sp.]